MYFKVCVKVEVNGFLNEGIRHEGNVLLNPYSPAILFG